MGTNKTLYGFMAFGPLALIIIGMIVMFSSFVGMESHNADSIPEAAMGMFISAIVLIMVASLLSIVSLIMYIIHISKNKLIPEDQRMYWIIGIVMASGIANIVYFFMYIMREEQLMADQQAQQKPKSPWE